MPIAPTEPCAGRAEALCIFVREAPLNLLVVDLELRCVAASPSNLATFGHRLEDIAGRRMGELLKGSEQGLQEIVDALAGGAPQHAIIRQTRTPDGARRWFETKGSYWRDDAGEVAGYLLASQDVTARREAEAARHEMELLLQAVIDNIPASLSVQDAQDGRYLLVNPQAAEHLNAPKADLLDRTLQDLEAGEAVARMGEIREDLRNNGGVRTLDYTLVRGRNAGRTLRLTKLIFNDGQGRKRLLSIGEDVTDLREATRALEAAVAEAEAANAAKSRFLANVSHEIRTPLNGVLGMAQAMARDPLPEVQRARLDMVRQSGETLLILLNDLLDLAKIEAGKIELENLEFDAAETVRSACAPFRVLAEQKGVAFEVCLQTDRDLRRGDPTRLRQVVVNLVSNAVKFTEQGRIRLEVSQGDDELAIEIRDTGIGMDPEAQRSIFEKFSQADVSTTRRFGGTGLGLSICRDLVELMGGRIAVQSAPGQGSTFTFALPLPRLAEDPEAADTVAPSAAQPQARALRLLAAEDNPINRLVLRTLLEQSGLEVTLVEDGVAAVEAWARERWDVILMDVQMPVMDGVAATAEIRAREAAGRRERVPIIALTANAMAHHATEYAACGMDGVVAKPIQLEVLLGVLDQALTAAEARRGPQAVAV